MQKNRLVKILLIAFLAIIMLGMNSTVNARGNIGNNKQYFIATDGEINAGIDSHNFIDTWAGGLLERYVTFEWYAIYKGGIVSIASQGWKIGGVKAEFKVYDSGNDIFLYMRIYKGSASSPKISETIVWQVINGKDSTHDIISSFLISIDSGKQSQTISLSIGGEDTIGLPFSSSYSCRMWLL